MTNLDLSVYASALAISITLNVYLMFMFAKLIRTIETSLTEIIKVYNRD